MAVLSPSVGRPRRLPALLCVCIALVGACSSGDAAAPAPNVTVVTDLSQTFDCNARDCLAQYRSFVANHALFPPPLPFEDALAGVREIGGGPLPRVMRLSQEKLRAQI